MSTLAQFIVAEKKKKEDAKYAMFGKLISPLLLGAIFSWENYVILQCGIVFWQWAVLSIGVWFVPMWIRKVTLGPIFAATVIGQLAKWCGLVILPLIKH